ncbi:minor tail protein [Microbacterium phage Jayden]|uniref:Minor tail protein n=1 Tax=Microbacterium phage Jayden TaxID=2656550 RepID=A0A649VSM0_9CAUD|nr:minor tail protein [Microbacterium phage Jayden]QGJ95261.1 minor tail protein [Microbacterium phage Jayden]
MSRPPVRDEEALLRAHERRIRLLERRLAASGYSPPHEVQYAGSTVERDAYFGIPATAAERAALANRSVTWYNTDFGWEESYYAVTGTAGLTALGLAVGVAPGWYPVGEGPFSIMYASGAQSVTASTYVTSWSAWGGNGSIRRGGADWFTYSAGRVTCVKPGRYEAEAMVTQQAGSGTTVVHLLRDALTVFQRTNPLDGSQVQAAVMHQPNVEMAAGQTFSVFNGIGSYQLNVATGNREVRGFFSVRYKSPHFASE